jgi:hypothetical protein
MNHVEHARAARRCLAVALATMAGAAWAAHGGGGGGDSSMNPFTGDSYAYFHGGHNLGEGAMIRPGGTPPQTGWQLYPWRGRAASDAPVASAPTTATPPAERRYVPAPSATPPTTAR